MRAHIRPQTQASTGRDALVAPSHPLMRRLGRHERGWGQPGCFMFCRTLNRGTGADRLAQALNSSRQHTPQVLIKGGITTAAVGSAYSTQTVQEVVTRFYDGLNQRDFAAIASCFAPDAMYENLAVEGVLAGREAVAQFCIDSIFTVPEDAFFIVQQQTEGASSSTAVVWQLVTSASQTTLSRGIAFYTINQQGLISGVTECHEHPVKVTHSSLAIMRPLVKSLSGPMLPAVQEVNRTLQQGIGSLLDPLNALVGLVQQPPLQPQAQPPASSTVTPGQVRSRAVGAAVGASTAWPPSSAPPASQPWSSSSSGSVGIRNAPGSGMSSSFALSAGSQSTAAAAGSRPAPPYARVQAAAARRSAASSPAAADEGAASAQHDVVDLSGLWAKDPARSDGKGYDAMLDVLGLSGLQKVTARLIEGIEIKQARDQFTVGFVTVVPFFKVTETAPLDAGSTQQSRRDLRPGRQEAKAKTVEGGVLVEMSWGQPLAGCLTECYTLLPDGSLCVHAEARVGQQQAAADSIYIRSQGSKDALLSDSRKRNGSFNDVIKRQQRQGL